MILIESSKLATIFISLDHEHDFLIYDKTPVLNQTLALPPTQTGALTYPKIWVLGH